MYIYNSMGKQKQRFVSREEKKVKLFSCGPSVYQKPHIGNYRTFLYEDIVVRYLEYKGYHVERAMNLTDIEDKAVTTAVANGRDVFEQTAPAKASFNKDIKSLAIKAPILAMASGSISEAITIIKILMDKGIAYENKGDIFFDALKNKDFGKLYGLDMSRWPKTKKRYRLDTYPGERWNLGDFVLWHRADSGSNESHAVWDSPWGKGRPSWNVQDPAMILQTLGEQVDINCGGIDNIIRHHDYNIAVMESTFNKEYARYYMHGAHLYIDGKKMSKSLGNIIYPDDIIAKGYSGLNLRYMLLAGKHYRTKLNFTMELFDRYVVEHKELLTLYKQSSNTITDNPTGLATQMQDAFEQAMDDDLQVKIACASLRKLFKKVKGCSKDEKDDVELQFSKINNVLQLI